MRVNGWDKWLRGHSHRIGYIPQLLIKEIPSLGSSIYLHMPLPALAKVLKKDFRHTLFTGSEITTIKNRAYFINQHQCIYRSIKNILRRSQRQHLRMGRKA